MASASEDASDNVKSVAEATEELTGSVGEIGRLVKEPPDRSVQRKIPLFTTVHRKHLMIEE